MQFRWVAVITMWTFLSGPLLGPPHAPSPQRDNQPSPLRQVAEQPPHRRPSNARKLPAPPPNNRGARRPATSSDASSAPPPVRAW